jgi:CBS-domain-containing membrane protein
MTRRPVTVPEECPIQRAIGQMRAAEIRHLVVVDGDRVTGIVSTATCGGSSRIQRTRRGSPTRSAAS